MDKTNCIKVYERGENMLATRVQDYISVKLQQPFSYSLIPIIICAILFGMSLVYFCVSYVKSRPNTVKPQIHMATPKNREKIKQFYLDKINQLHNAIVTQQIDSRNAYQKMSCYIREFVYEMTGMEVQKYTLQDIQQLKMPVLESLIAEYYVPEFAYAEEGNALASIEKTKRIMEKWI